MEDKALENFLPIIYFYMDMLRHVKIIILYYYQVMYNSCRRVVTIVTLRRSYEKKKQVKFCYRRYSKRRKTEFYVGTYKIMYGMEHGVTLSDFGFEKVLCFTSIYYLTGLIKNLILNRYL